MSAKNPRYLEEKAPKFRTIEEELDHMKKQLNLQRMTLKRPRDDGSLEFG